MANAHEARTGQREVEELRARLAEAQQTLQAIRSGEVDALVVDGPNGPQVFTLQTPDQPYRLLIERMSEGTASISDQGIILFCNQRLADMVGQPLEKLVGSPISALVLGAEQEHLQQLLARGLQGETRDEIQFQRPDGTAMSVQVSLRAIEAEQLRSICLVATDLSELRQVEKTARLYTRTLIEASLDPLVTISREGKITDVNEATEKITGVGRDQLIGSEFCNYFTEPDKAHAGYQQVFGAGQVRDYPLAIRHTSGQITEVLYNATVFKNPQGEVQGAFAAARDITAQKQAQQKLRDQAALLDLAQDAIIFRGLDSRIRFWNRGARDLYGWSAEEALGQIGHELLQTAFPISLEELHAAIHKTREWEGELTHTCRDGRRIVVASRWSLLRDEQGTPTAVLEINRDITSRKQAEEALRQASRYTRSLIEASLDPLVTISRKGKITDVNEATEKVTGMARERLIGSDFCDYFTEPEKARQGYERVFAESSVRDYPLAIQHTSGTVTDVLYNATVFRNEQGEVEGVFAAARDITARKLAEQEIRTLNEELEQRVAARTEELRAVNKELEAFNYAVAHDLRAPLRHIHGFAEILADEAGPVLDPSSQRHLQLIRDSVQHMGQLLEDLLGLSRIGRQELSKQICGLRSLAVEVVNGLMSEIQEREVEWRIGELPFVECDPGLMRQAITNLLTNALKFTRPRPRAVIEIGQMMVGEEPVVFVRDNGVGFSMKYADKLFGLFQRLHRQQDFEGTGVGLAIVQRIIHRHGGQVWADGELNNGATFYFKLRSSAMEPEPQAMGQQVA